MKTEFLSLSAAGAFALMFSGFLLGEAYARFDPLYIIMAVLMLLVARGDARVGFETGSYQRGWFFWKRIGGVA